MPTPNRQAPWNNPSFAGKARKRLTCECRAPRQSMAVSGGELCATCYRPIRPEVLAKLARAARRAANRARKAGKRMALVAFCGVAATATTACSDDGHPRQLLTVSYRDTVTVECVGLRRDVDSAGTVVHEWDVARSLKTQRCTVRETTYRPLPTPK